MQQYIIQRDFGLGFLLSQFPASANFTRKSERSITQLPYEASTFQGFKLFCPAAEYSLQNRRARGTETHRGRISTAWPISRLTGLVAHQRACSTHACFLFFLLSFGISPVPISVFPLSQERNKNDQKRKLKHRRLRFVNFNNIIVIVTQNLRKTGRGGLRSQ